MDLCQLEKATARTPTLVALAEPFVGLFYIDVHPKSIK